MTDVMAANILAKKSETEVFSKSEVLTAFNSSLVSTCLSKLNKHEPLSTAERLFIGLLKTALDKARNT